MNEVYCPFCGVERGERCITKRRHAGAPVRHRSYHKVRFSMGLALSMHQRWPDKYPAPLWYRP